MNPLRLGWRKTALPTLSRELFHYQGHRYAKFTQCTQAIRGWRSLWCSAGVALLPIVRRQTVPSFNHVNPIEMAEN